VAYRTPVIAPAYGLPTIDHPRPRACTQGFCFFATTINDPGLGFARIAAFSDRQVHRHRLLRRVDLERAALVHVAAKRLEVRVALEG
jgi:hypothetical protein